MKTRIFFAAAAFLIVILIISGCSGSSKTQVKYIGPEGYVVQEITRPADAKPAVTNTSLNENSSKPIPVEIKSNESNKTAPAPPANNASSNTTLGTDHDDSGLPDYFSSNTMQTEKAKITDVLPRLCDDSQILIIGYVACTYDNRTGYVDLTLKNDNKGDIEQIWFYITNNLQKVNYEKSGGIRAGEAADYALPIPRWTKDYGKIDRIVVTPVLKTPYGLYACNNKQILVYWTKSTSGCPIG